MPRLTNTDLHEVLTLAEDLLEVSDFAGVAGRLLGRVAKVVGSDTATLTHVDLQTGHEVAVLWPTSRPLGAALAAYPALAHTHPLRRPSREAARSGRRVVPVRISDVMTARTWRRTPLRTEAMPDVTDQMALPLRRRGSVLHALTLGRLSGTFTDRQRDLLAHGSAHVAAAVSRTDRGDGVGLQLAPELEWVPLAAAPGLGARRSAPPSYIRPAVPALSERERQVLSLVAEGLTDAQVARRLGIRPATVSRHLHRIYTRHGLGNRVAAVKLLGGPTADAVSAGYSHPLTSRYPRL